MMTKKKWEAIKNISTGMSIAVMLVILGSWIGIYYSFSCVVIALIAVVILLYAIKKQSECEDEKEN